MTALLQAAMRKNTAKSIARNGNEVQTLTLTLNGGTGDFTLTVIGQTTGAIAHDATAATIQTALEALSSVAVGDVQVSGALTTGLTIEFCGALAGSDIAAITADLTGITGDSPAASMAIAETRKGGQLATGTYTFTNDGRTILHCTKVGATDCTVTVTTPGEVDGNAIADPTYTVPAKGGEKWIGPFPVKTYGEEVTVAFSNATGLSVAVVSCEQA